MLSEIKSAHAPCSPSYQGTQAICPFLGFTGLLWQQICYVIGVPLNCVVNSYEPLLIFQTQLTAKAEKP